MHLTLGWGRVRWRAGGCSAGAQKEYSPQVYKHPLTSSSLSLAGSIYQAGWWGAWRLPSAQALIGVSGVATFLPLGSASRASGREPLESQKPCPSQGSSLGVSTDRLPGSLRANPPCHWDPASSQCLG